jgi:chromosome segregation ATPase
MTDKNQKDWSMWAMGGIGAMAAAYAGMATAKPTVEELASELEHIHKSHVHANRALSNMSVALSDAMDRIAWLENEARKKELEKNKLADALMAKISKLQDRVTEEQRRADTAEKTLRESSKGPEPL